MNFHNKFTEIQTKKLFVAFIIVLITIFDRLYNIGRVGLWGDEVFTAVIGYQDQTIIEVIKGALSTPLPAPPLIYIVSHIWMKIVGFDDVLIRIPFVIAGSLGIPAIYLAGKSLYNKRAGIISGLLLFFSSMHIFHSREARYYPFLTLFTTLSVYFLNQAIRFKEIKWWVGFIITSTLNIFTFHTALFVLAAQGIYVFIVTMIELYSNQLKGLQGWKESDLAKYTLSLGLITLFYSPLLPSLLSGLSNSRGLTSKDISGRFSSKFFLEGLIPNFFGGGDAPINVFILFALAGLFLFLKKHYMQSIQIALIFIFPFIVLEHISIKHWVEFKYFIFILPLFLILIAQGIENIASLFTYISINEEASASLWPNMLTILFLIVVLSVNSRYYHRGYRQRADYWREQGTFVNQILGSSDILVTYKKNHLITMTSQDMISLYFNPENNSQEYVPIVSVSEDLSELLYTYDHVILHISQKELENAKDITSWIKNKVHIKLKFADFSMIYIGRDATLDELKENIKDFKKFIDHGDY